MFKQFVRAEIAAGLDETYQFEDWEAAHPGRGYHDVHVAVIQERETCVPTLRRVLGATPLRILESGCGSGRWVAFLERLGHRVVGLDDSAAPLAVARRHDPAMRLVRGDVVSAPFRGGSFDVVFSSYVAEHFEDGPRALFDEIRRLLVPGGRLLLIVPCDNPFRRLLTDRALQAFYAVCRLRRRPLAFTEYRFRPTEMTALLGAAGFRVEHCEPDDFRHPWAKGLSLDLGPLVRPRGAPPGTWELNPAGRALSRLLNGLSPWAACAGALFVARAEERP
ncbi:MAG: class I SAM-dependent methyltransferase [bacterium]